MKVGDWVIEDLVSYGFFAYEIANIFMSLIVVICMVVKIWKEMKERFIDVLRMVQYCLILTWFLYVTYYVIFSFWDEHIGNMVKILDGIMDGVLIYYYIFNLTTCYLLMYQIKVLKLLRNGIEYKNANKQTKSHEIKIITLLALFICIYSILNVSLSVFSSSISLLQNNQRLINLLKYTFFYIALLILNLILFIKLSVIMKDNLNYYFLNNWKNIRFIFHLTSAFYAVFILLNLFEIIFDLDDNKIERDPLFSNELIRIFCLLIYIFLNVLRLLYVFFNFKGINFKYWILDIYKGYKILDLYHRSSIFIIKNKFYKEDLESSSLVSDIESLSISSQADNNNYVDYEVNDEYMKNYKLTYLSSQKSNKQETSYNNSIF